MVATINSIHGRKIGRRSAIGKRSFALWFMRAIVSGMELKKGCWMELARLRYLVDESRQAVPECCLGNNPSTMLSYEVAADTGAVGGGHEMTHHAPYPASSRASRSRVQSKNIAILFSLSSRYPVASNIYSVNYSSHMMTILLHYDIHLHLCCRFLHLV